MFNRILKFIFGSRNDRLLRRYQDSVDKINALEPSIQALSDEALTQKTTEFRDRFKAGETLDDLLPEAFAVVREAGQRVLSMRHFDVQLIGGIALHEGKIAEMRTGEGKTLVATLPVYLNALAGEGVHVVTVNDYLAQRDAEWMGKLYNFLGMSVGVNLPNMSHKDKQAAYHADITYGTNNEYGFDYLRDNMVHKPEDRVQRKLFFGVVDEVDSILIDEARTPLIISGQADEQNDLYVQMNQVPALLKKQESEEEPADFTVDEKMHQVLLTELGHEHAEEILARLGMLDENSSLYDAANIRLMHHLNSALRAHHLFFRDQQYVVQNGEIIIVDEFTGRLMEGRRWSDGLHQAVEAKEGVEIQKENQTLASITFQNYFRMYDKLAGMTGTADTEAYEFQQIYGLETVVIPTHQPMVRKDLMDQVYCTGKEKYAAVIKDIKDCYDRGQPVLVGTTSIENSEMISKMLEKEKLPHQVLNAKQHEKEALIVAQAGRPRMITIATNMAGRGTDIVLGGNVEKQIEQLALNSALDDRKREAAAEKLQAEWLSLHDEVLAAGGLHIIGTERHESRRVDNQLRGRSGRQGDPGSSRFYLSLEDPLMRIFGGDRIKALMQRLKMPEGEPIEHPMITRSIETSQRRVESRNFDIRKQLLEFDDVANDQRKIIYQQRNEVLEADDISETVTNLRAGAINDIFCAYVPEGTVAEQWDLPGLEAALLAEFQLSVPVQAWLQLDAQMERDDLLEKVIQAADDYYQNRVNIVGRAVFSQVEKSFMLQLLDTQWRDHLSQLDQLRQGVHLRGYAQQNPKQEYKRDAFRLLENMLHSVKMQLTKLLMTIRIQTEEEVKAIEEAEKAAAEAALKRAQFKHQSTAVLGANDDAETKAGAKPQPVTAAAKVGRNDPCPCGSGKKYKQCHGKPD